MSAARILVIRGGAVGDFVLTLPAIGALRERWPDGHIEVLGYSRIIELAANRYYANAVRSIESRQVAGFFARGGELDPSWMKYFGGFNLVVSYLYDPDEIFAENLERCGVKHLVKGTPKPVELHAADHYCKPLESLAIYQNHAVPRIYTTAVDRIAAAKFLGELARDRIVAIHPGSGGKAKMWPAEKFSAVGRWVADELAARVLIVEGEADGEAAGKLAEMLGPRVAARARGLKLVELAAVLERCACFVGNDSGISHMAAAVGTPTVAMFGPVSNVLWEPRGDRVRVVAFGENDVREARQAIHELGWGDGGDGVGNLAGIG